MLVFGYLNHPGRTAAGNGMRVRSDGTVELTVDGTNWEPIASLTREETEQLADLTRSAGIPDLPEETERPETMRDGSDCELWTDLDGRSVHAVIRGWADGNPAAAPSRELVMKFSALVSAAQSRR